MPASLVCSAVSRHSFWDYDIGERVQKGRLVLLVFWETTGSSYNILNPLAKLQAKHVRDMDILLITHEDVKTVQKFLNKTRISKLTFLVDDRRVTNSLFHACDPPGVPYAMVVNGGGDVSWRGHPQDPAMEAMIVTEMASEVARKPSHRTRRFEDMLQVERAKAERNRLWREEQRDTVLVNALQDDPRKVHAGIVPSLYDRFDPSSLDNDEEADLETLEINDRVEVIGTHLFGVVKFIGALPRKTGVWVGLAMELGGEGSHDGVIGGVRYFRCSKGRGRFFPRSDVRSTKASKLHKSSGKPMWDERRKRWTVEGAPSSPQHTRKSSGSRHTDRNASPRAKTSDHRLDFSPAGHVRHPFGPTEAEEAATKRGDELEEKVAELNVRINAMKEAFRQHDLEQSAHVHELELALQDTGKERDDLRDDKERLENTCADQQENVLSLEEANKGQEQQIDTATRQIESLQNDVERLTAAQLAAEEHIEQLKLDLKAKDDDLTTTTEELVTMKNDNLYLEKEAAKSAAEIARLKESADGFKSNISTLTEEAATSKKTLAEQKKSIEALEKDLKKAKDASEKNKEENANLKKELEEVQERADAEEHKAAEVTQELEATQEQLDEIHKEQEALTKARDEKAEEAEKSEREAAALRAEVEDLKKQLHDCGSAEDLEASQLEVARLKEELRKYEEGGAAPATADAPNAPADSPPPPLASPTPPPATPPAPPPPSSFPLPSKVKVTVIKATNLHAADGSTSDPVVELALNGHEVKTTVKKETLDPIWNESFTLDVGQDNSLVLNVWDDDRIGRDDPMGTALVDLSKHDTQKTVDLPDLPVMLMGNQEGTMSVRLDPV